jgi:1-acyl-sn-glycerol-3-phosphate acyltransferase
LLFVVNHPNALVDALLVGWVVPRRVLITAKSTLFKNPIANLLLRSLGVLPLQRASDLGAGERANPLRNRDTFRSVLHALGRGGAVLIFPEGKSHDEPALAPLKTGAARIAIQARDASCRLAELAIVPIGLIFERKDAPRSRVLVRVGEPILLDAWRAQDTSSAVEELTADIDARLRAVTLNYSSADDATRAARIASLVAAAHYAVPDAPRRERGLGVEAGIAVRVDEIARLLKHADDPLRARADALLARLDAAHELAAEHAVSLEDAAVSLRSSDAARFVTREGWMLLFAGPIAAWGRINHWLPFRAARAVAMRSVDSAADPAMRTLVAGVAFVLVSYSVQTIAVGLLLGWLPAGAYLVSLPMAAEINFRLSERLHRAAGRARAFMALRRSPELRRRLIGELSAVRDEITAFDAAVSSTFAQRDRTRGDYDRAEGGGR